MKAVAIINFCVALLLTLDPNDVRTYEITEVLNEMAKNGEVIDGIFKPRRNGLLGFGSCGTTYKGEFVPHDNMKVAMKFYPFWKMYYSRKEYEMYTYLGAVNNNQSVRNYGIPDIYYYGEWHNHTMLAMTLLDCRLQDRFIAGNINQLNLFILFREFVKAMKYIHSRGITHSGICFSKMTLHKGRGFLFDFGMSMDIADGIRSDNVKRAKYDFWKLLDSVFRMFKKTSLESKWHWIGFSIDKDADRMRDVDQFVAGLAEDVNSNQWNSFTGLRRVFAEFAKHVLDKESTSVENANGTSNPFYDHLYRVIIAEMPKYGLGATSYPSLSHIPDPFGGDKCTRPEVKYDLFEEMYAKQIQDARKKE